MPYVDNGVAYRQKHRALLAAKQRARYYGLTAEQRSSLAAKQSQRVRAQKEAGVFNREPGRRYAREAHEKRKHDPAYRRRAVERAVAWQRAHPTAVQNNIQRRLARNLRSRLAKAVKRGSCNSSAVRDLGLSLPEFLVYLEGKFADGMTWDNYGSWHIDHIKPLASFDLTDAAQSLAACHYTNLQPLWKRDNQSKSCRAAL